MVLRRYKAVVSLAKLRELAKTNAEGTTALGIIEAAKSLGFETKAIKADLSLFEVPDISLHNFVKNSDELIFCHK